jgi:hypothetical protein
MARDYRSSQLKLICLLILICSVLAANSPEAQKGIMDQIQEQRSSLLDGTAVEAIVTQVSEAVGFITQSEAHQ